MRTAPKATKKVLKESASASTAPQSSLKGIFNRLSEGAPVAIPVMQQGNNKATTTGVVSVTDTSPAGKAISDTINSLAQQKKIQVVTPQSTAPAQAGQPAATAPKPNTPPAPAGATGQPPAGATQVKEKWGDIVSFDKIVDKYTNEMERFKETGDLTDELYDALYELWFDDMPYGVQKARTGDPYEWIGRKLDQTLGDDTVQEGFKEKVKGVVRRELAKDVPIIQNRSDYAIGKAADSFKSGKIKNGNRYMKYVDDNDKSIKEADRPSNSMDMGAGLGAGRSQATFEGKKGVNPFAKKDAKAEKAGKKVTKDIEFDEKKKDGIHGKKRGPEDKKAEKAGKKVAKDIEFDEKKDKKKKVKESMSHGIKAARLTGRSHGLKGHSHCGKNYDNMEEARAYHEGFKQGLDECYGQGVYEGLAGTAGGAIAGGMLGGPLGALAGGMLGSEMSKESAPAMPAATVGGMANAAMEDEFDEGNAFTAALARTPKGGHFKVGGKSFKDRSNYDADVEEGVLGAVGGAVLGGAVAGQSLTKGGSSVIEDNTFAFEAWDKELQTLLTEGEEVREGVSVSISKGNQGSPDTVNINATDAEADKVLQFIKTAGLGVFGGEDTSSDYGSSADSDENHGGISVVGDHDNMLSIMKRLSGVAGGSHDDSEDYADENGAEDESAMCDSCGSEQNEGHECGDEKQMVDEVETEDQMEFQVAEDNPPDSGAANATNDEQGNAAANSALATADAQQNADDKEETVSEEEEEDEDEEEDFFHNPNLPADKQLKSPPKEVKLDEWANDAGPGKSVSDTTFEQDIEFMTKVISGGLNKPKSTGQTTVPVVASQLKRLHTGPTTDVNESVVMDWQTLAGIK